MQTVATIMASVALAVSIVALACSLYVAHLIKKE